MKNLPYRISDFVPFVEAAITLYKHLGIVEAACYPVLDAVVTSIKDEYVRLLDRIENWATIEKKPEMLAEARAMEANRHKSSKIREKFAAGVEFAITLKKKRLSFRDVTEGVLAVTELNRLRQLELTQEFNHEQPSSFESAQEYLGKWNRVIMGSAEETIEGAMMPVSYWYEDFMPKLLAAFSVSRVADITPNTVADETDLNDWYATVKSSGDLAKYGTDVLEGFSHCTPSQKLAVQQAWRLTHHYLNGIQKRRERLEFGRETGFLSQYVSFIDIYLGRNDIKNAEMRVSFPYYIGPAMWRFFHTMAEIVDMKSAEEQRELVGLFKGFIQFFAQMYPCPYCRHHFNAYVILNKEVDMYPMEYLLLGRDPNLTDFGVYLDAKLSTITDGNSLRLFFWKLHNTVSSSIARSEEWYHKDEKAFYTTRYWPSLDSELAKAKALGQYAIELKNLTKLYGILKPISQLAAVRQRLGELVEAGNTEKIREACLLCERYIQQLEENLNVSEFLQEMYHFNPALTDEDPFFTPEEENFARSGQFVEIR